MKKIVSTQGLLFGHFDAPYMDAAIRERVNNRLEYCYNLNSRNGDIHVDSRFSYELFNGQVTSILLSYTIDDPTPQRLEDFRGTCDSFYELHGFLIDDDGDTPSVYFKATDIYDMATLIHALDCLTVSLEGVMCAIDANLTERDAIYSPSGSHLLQLPDVPRYKIKEGTIFISPLAARYCKRLRQLNVPHILIDLDEALCDYPHPLKVTRYEETADENDEDEPDDYDESIFDDYGVLYSKDGKKLVGCRHTFNETRYEVPNGVEEIDDCAFVSCRHFVELSIPRSVKTIGDSLFGNGGVIVIRDE